MIFANNINSLKRYLYDVLHNINQELTVVSSAENTAYYGEVNTPMLTIDFKKITTKNMVINHLYSNNRETCFAEATFTLSLYSPLEYTNSDEIIMSIYNTLIFDDIYDFHQIVITEKTFNYDTQFFITTFEVDVSLLINR